MRHARPLRQLLLSALGTACALSAAQAQRTAGSGYLFGPPDGSVTIRMGYARPTAGSDLFSYTTGLLSLSKGDFAAVEFGADLGIAQGDHWEWLLSADVAKRTAGSDYRSWTGSNGLPIEQQTTFVRVPVLFGARYWLRPQGTRVGSLAWIPAAWSPFVSLQAGMMWYEFHQAGDFVNFGGGNAVFAGDLTSNGWTPTAALSAGAAINLNNYFSVITQARYAYARTTLGPDFRGFEPIDLAGLSVTAGLSLRIH